MPVRAARRDDSDAVLRMMAHLWADEEGFVFEPDWTFVWDEPSDGLGGFVSFSVRPFVDGCESAPCAHIEGWWVEPAVRGRGIGRALIARVESWAAAKGFAELGSDALISNSGGAAAHVALGFEPTEQIQYFRKALDPNSAQPDTPR